MWGGFNSFTGCYTLELCITILYTWKKVLMKLIIKMDTKMLANKMSTYSSYSLCILACKRLWSLCLQLFLIDHETIAQYLKLA